MYLPLHHSACLIQKYYLNGVFVPMAQAFSKKTNLTYARTVALSLLFLNTRSYDEQGNQYIDFLSGAGAGTNAAKTALKIARKAPPLNIDLKNLNNGLDIIEHALWHFYQQNQS